MSSISVDTDTKAEFDELKPDGLTHGEFVDELLAAYRRDNGEIVNPDAIADEVTKQTGASVELAAYRGTREALQKVLNDD